VRKTIQGLAEEIAGNLIQELRSWAADEIPPAAGAAGELAGHPAEEIPQRLPVLSSAGGETGHGVQDRLLALENRLEEMAERSEGPSAGGETAKFPNLKYAKSKYRNVESLLNYIETKESEGGIKLVIMNFND